MKKLFAVIALVAFFGSVSAPAFATVVQNNTTITLLDEKPKKAEKKKSDKKECCESKCKTAEKKSCDEKGKK